MSDFPISKVSITIEYNTTDGVKQVKHEIDSEKVQIISCIHQVDHKTRPVKNEGKEIVGYEPTGEQLLLLKVKSIQT